jgi:uncharacterized alpha-E superfamily protein
MISRVADHCFWFGRYIERAESTARLLQATRTLVFDADLPVTQCWQPLVIVSGEYPRFVEKFGAESAGDGEKVQDYMTWNPENPVSLLSSIRAGRESARIIRDVLSLDTWESTNELYHFLSSENAKQLYADNREDLYRTIRRLTQLTLAHVCSTMLHDEPMSFLWLGVMLERVGQLARTLDMHHHTMEREHAHEVVQTAVWLSLLRANSGQEAFMKTRQGRVSAKAVVHFLLHEPTFPRSLAYCLRSAQSTLNSIWPPMSQSQGTQSQTLSPRPSQQRLASLISHLESTTPTTSPQIHSLLTHIVDETAAISTALNTEIHGR